MSSSQSFQGLEKGRFPDSHFCQIIMLLSYLSSLLELLPYCSFSVIANGYRSMDGNKEKEK